MTPTFANAEQFKAYYTEAKVAELRAAFDRVANKDDWKEPVDAWIDHRAFSLVAEAVEFFTATELKVVGGPQPITGWILVHADGYRRGPAN